MIQQPHLLVSKWGLFYFDVISKDCFFAFICYFFKEQKTNFLIFIRKYEKLKT